MKEHILIRRTQIVTFGGLFKCLCGGKTDNIQPSEHNTSTVKHGNGTIMLWLYIYILWKVVGANYRAKHPHFDTKRRFINLKPELHSYGVDPRTGMRKMPVKLHFESQHT